MNGRRERDETVEEREMRPWERERKRETERGTETNTQTVKKRESIKQTDE